MPFDTRNFQDPDFSGELLAHLLDHEAPPREAQYRRYWEYYRNPLLPSDAAYGAMNENSRPYVLAQEVGLPARITGVRRGATGESMTDLRRKEVVIENDIGWRVQTMIDFLFGRPVTIRSRAAGAETAAGVERILQALLEANGGVSFLQEAALFAAVYGYVDIVLRVAPDWPSLVSSPFSPLPVASGAASSAPEGSASAGRNPGDRSKRMLERAVHLARMLRLETVEAPRILPIPAEDDPRQLRYWIQRFAVRSRRAADAPRRSWWRSGAETAPRSVERVEILSADWWQRYEDRRLIAEGPNALGRLPVVHIQNVADPGSYAGLSDVEPLIPLQDELNTRLSDRAARVTYQSFKMYLGKGIDHFLERPIGPGQMWATQNPDASIEEFGSDNGSPSEDAHIEQIRRALDKTSGVTPLAAGLIGGNVGRLTSAAALRVVLSGLLARTERKRLTFAAGLETLVDLVLDWLDRTGVFPTRSEDRRVDIHWPSPLPIDDAEQLRNARLKRSLGVPLERILAELGYAMDNRPPAADREAESGSR